MNAGTNMLYLLLYKEGKFNNKDTLHITNSAQVYQPEPGTPYMSE